MRVAQLALEAWSSLLLLLAVGGAACNPVKDHGIGISVSTPIAVGAYGFAGVIDTCRGHSKDLECGNDEVNLISAQSSDPTVIELLERDSGTSYSSVEYHARAPGQATITVVGENLPIRKTLSAEVVAKNADSVPVWHYLDCPGRLLISTGVSFDILYKLLSGSETLYGARYIPLDFGVLTNEYELPVESRYMFEQGAHRLQLRAPIEAGVGAIVPRIGVGPGTPFEVFAPEDVSALVLSEPTEHMESTWPPSAPAACISSRYQTCIVRADLVVGNEIACIDRFVRSLEAEPADVCSVLSATMGPKFSLTVSKAGTCTVTVRIDELGLVSVRQYMVK